MAAAVKIVPFKYEHLDLVDTRDSELTGILKLPNAEERLRNLAEASLGGTLLYDGRIICCLGAVELWPGVIDVWVIPTKYLVEKPLIFVKTVKNYLLRFVEDFQCHRVQTVAVDDELHSRFLTWLGFSKEGVMKEYSCNRETYNMWSRMY